MLLGAIYIVFGSGTFIYTFQGFLITLGVPIAAWCGVFLADVALRRRDYAQADLYTASGRYGSIRWIPVVALVLGTVIGWGLVTNTYAGWLDWQGYLLGPIGGRTGDWAGANLGVLVSLVIGFAGGLATWLPRRTAEVGGRTVAR
jgi:purine-cytosine permease-like protein